MVFRQRISNIILVYTFIDTCYIYTDIYTVYTYTLAIFTKTRPDDVNILFTLAKYYTRIYLYNIQTCVPTYITAVYHVYLRLIHTFVNELKPTQ